MGYATGRVNCKFATLIALCGLYYIIHGSFESYPTAEQMGKARIAGGMLFLLGGLIISRWNL